MDDCKLEMDEIVLVGGSSRIPKLQVSLKVNISEVLTLFRIGMHLFC